MLIRDSETKLTITDFPQMEACFALLPFFVMILGALKIIPSHPLYSITAVIFLLIYLFGARFCSVILDREVGKIFWKKIGILSNEAGECNFEQVKEIAIETTNISQPFNRKNYRIVLCLEGKAVPFTDTFQYGKEKTLERLEQMGRYSGIALGQNFLEIEQK